MSKPYRCRGSFKIGTACAQQDLPEGVTECAKCKAEGYDVAKRDAAIAAEAERTKDFPADRVKRGNEVRITSQPQGAANAANPTQKP